MVQARPAQLLLTLRNIVDWFTTALGIFLFGERFIVRDTTKNSKALDKGAAVGWCFDHYGPRPLLVTGAAIYASSIMMISFCKSYYQYLLAQGVLSGLGVGLMSVSISSSYVVPSSLNPAFPRFYPPISSIATHFSEYRATALGIAAAGSSAGGIVFPIMLRRLFVHVGFPYAVRISGFLCLLCCGISALTTTSARPPSSTRFKLEDYTSCFKDTKYLLLLIGSALISLGTDLPHPGCL